MPEVRIDKVEIIGIVTDKTDLAKYTSYTGKNKSRLSGIKYHSICYSSLLYDHCVTVDDATGAIPVLGMNNIFDESTTSEESDDSTTSKEADEAEPVKKCKEVDEVEPCCSKKDKRKKRKADEADEPGGLDKCKATDKSVDCDEEDGGDEDNPDIESEIRLPPSLPVHAPYSYERVSSLSNQMMSRVQLIWCFSETLEQRNRDFHI